MRSAAIDISLSASPLVEVPTSFATFLRVYLLHLKDVCVCYFVCVRVPRFLLLAIHRFLPFRLLPFRFFPPFFLLVHLVKQLFPLLVGLYASSFASRVFFLPIFLSKQMKRRKGRKKTKRKNPKKSRGKKKIFFQSAKTRRPTKNETLLRSKNALVV